jgi:hypothetical protein
VIPATLTGDDADGAGIFRILMHAHRRIVVRCARCARAFVRQHFLKGALFFLMPLLYFQ